MELTRGAQGSELSERHESLTNAWLAFATRCLCSSTKSNVEVFSDGKMLTLVLTASFVLSRAYWAEHSDE